MFSIQLWALRILFLLSLLLATTCLLVDHLCNLSRALVQRSSVRPKRFKHLRAGAKHREKKPRSDWVVHSETHVESPKDVVEVEEDVELDADYLYEICMENLFAHRTNEAKHYEN